MPGSAAGTVQFTDGIHNLGGPVTVVGGVAVGPFETLRPGSHAVIAMFTPANSTVFKSSMSNTVTFRF
jgi:uncharacterized protein (DUF2062 family)